jgi:hypothetical protein
VLISRSTRDRVSLTFSTVAKRGHHSRLRLLDPSQGLSVFQALNGKISLADPAMNSPLFPFVPHHQGCPMNGIHSSD